MLKIEVTVSGEKNDGNEEKLVHLPFVQLQLERAPESVRAGTVRMFNFSLGRCCVIWVSSEEAIARISGP